MSKPLALVIEDDYDLSGIYAEALQAAGFETQIFRSGDTAFVRLISTGIQPDLILLDLHLPRIAGTDILHRIRKEPLLAKTLVLIITADRQLAETVRDKADDILIKPIQFSELRDLAAAWLAKMKNKRPESA